jgi:ADP-ribosylglycohydrolase
LASGDHVSYADRVRGCLLGGAIGDALGAPVDSWSGKRIEREVDPLGVRDFRPSSFGGLTGEGLVGA